jgi:hypothetical protein
MGGEEGAVVRAHCGGAGPPSPQHGRRYSSTPHPRLPPTDAESFLRHVGLSRQQTDRQNALHGGRHTLLSPGNDALGQARERIIPVHTGSHRHLDATSNRVRQAAAVIARMSSFRFVLLIHCLSRCVQPIIVTPKLARVLCSPEQLRGSVQSMRCRRKIRPQQVSGFKIRQQLKCSCK